MATAKRASGKKASQEPESRTKDICFTIMPFGGWLDRYYENIYIPAIKSAGLEPHRADDLYRPSTIVNDIWAYTQQAKIVLADLTGRNPNVFYELGLAHALAKPAILVTETIDDVPFDLRALRIIEYDKNAPDWGSILKGKIETAIKEILESPVQAVLPAFLSVKESRDRPTVTLSEKKIIEIRKDLDMLRREVRSTSAYKRTSSRQSRNYNTEEDALNHFRNLVAQRLPEDIIMSIMNDGELPRGWVENQIASLPNVERAKLAE